MEGTFIIGVRTWDSEGAAFQLTVSSGSRQYYKVDSYYNTMDIILEKGESAYFEIYHNDESIRALKVTDSGEADIVNEIIKIFKVF